MLKLYKFLKPFWGIILAVLALVFLQTLADLFLPTLMSDVIDKGVMNGDTDLILRLGGRMLLFAGGGIVCAIFASFLSSKISMGFGRTVRNRVFEKVESFSLHEFDTFGAATLITRTTNDITQVQMVTMVILRMMIAAPMMAVGGIIMAMSKDRRLTLVFLVSLPVLIGAIALIASKGLPLFRVIQSKIDKMNLVLRERLTGIRVIRAFNRVDHEKERFEEANADLTRNYIRINKIMAFLMPTLMLVMNLTTLAILWFGIKRIDGGSMEMGSLIAFTQYAMQIMFSMLMVSMMFIMVPRAQAAAVRINEVLNTDPEIKDALETKTAEGTKGHLEFRNVTFWYHGAEQPALRDISFEAGPGEVTAIIGGTGAGKSTLLNLIPRFYEADSGSVLVDGEDVKQMSQDYLRGKIGFVPQKAVLFTGSITDNIRFGNEAATDAEVTEAAKTAQAMEFISSMDDGFTHEISQGGTNVSGGQKQRLSIARALARKPEILVFDDSFSALDFKTDSALRTGLKRLLETDMKDATVLIVAQRVGTVMDADRIIVLDEGSIVGMGTHGELLKSCQVYREITASQFGEDAAAMMEVTA